jgi:hypothetical protein
VAQKSKKNQKEQWLLMVQITPSFGMIPSFGKTHHTWRVSSKSPLSSNNFNLLIATADVYGFSMTSS